MEASKTGAADKGYIGHKSAKMMKRAKSIEARQQKAIEQKSGLLKNRERAEELKLLPLQYRSDTLVTFLDAAVVMGNSVSCPVSFSIRRGERVVLEGAMEAAKQSAQIRGGRSFGAYRDDHDGIWTCHFLCTTGCVTFAGDTF